jgi:hypothetical protein
MTPTSLRDRVLVGIAAQPSRTRAQGRTRAAVLFGLASVASAAPLLVFGVMRGATDMDGLSVAAGSLLIAFACAATSMWRGKSLVGHGAATLAAVALLAPLARFLWLSSWPSDAETDDPTCAARTIMSTVPFFVALFSVRVRRVVEHPFANGAALGTTAAAFGAVIVDVSCARAPPSHVFTAHVLPMIVSAIVGTFGGHFLIIRDRPRDLARARGVDRDESM